MSLEQKKLKADLSRVVAAKHEIDYLIDQKLEEVNRMKEALGKQEAAEKVLMEKINQLGEK